MNKKAQNEDFREEFDQLDAEIYKTFVELGWVIPQTEDEVTIAEKAWEKVQIPLLPTELKDSSSLIARLKKEQSLKVHEPSIEVNQTGIFKGILAVAKELKISNFQFADMTGLSIVLIAQFDRGLIKANEKLPLEIVKRIADTINVTTEQILDYLRLGPRFAKNANFKATDSPTLTEAQDFPDAVRQDPTLSDERREELLALS